MIIIEEVVYMRVDKVVECGLKLLLENDRYKTYDFGNDMHRILNRISFHYTISDISILEAFFMTQFSSHSIIDLDTYKKKEYMNIGLPLEELISIIDKSANNDYSLHPTNFVRKKIVVKFQGIDIYKITGMILIDFCESVKKNGIENTLIEFLVKKFYTFMGNILNSKDGKTSGLINDIFYKKYIHSKTSCVFATDIHTNKGSVNLFGDNVLGEMKAISNKNSSNDLLIFDNSSVYFTIKSSLYTFLELYNLIPSIFIDFLNINELDPSEHIPIIYDKYKKYNVQDIVNKYCESYKKILLLTESGIAIYKYDFHTLDECIIYSIRINLSDGNQLKILEAGVNTITSKIKDSVLGLDIRFIYDSIVSKLQTITKSISTLSD